MRLSAALSAVTASTFALIANSAFAGDPPAACGSAAHGCTEVNLNEGGCDDATCCGLVCEIEPFCCSGAWDNLCVALAQKFCDVCGIATTSCVSPSTSPGCNQAECCTAVCGTVGFDFCCEIAWDQLCVDQAVILCNGCDAPGAGKCHSELETAGCNDPACCASVCEIDPACCVTVWDAACVQWAVCQCILCGSPNTGGCTIPHETPFCNDRDCCDAVCEVDPFCCNVRWDDSCVERATIVCTLDIISCGDPASGSCKVVHAGPGCNDLTCCGEVCNLDGFCCEVTWDAACVGAYKVLCSEIAPCNEPGSGSCFVRHNGPGCDDVGCCGEVCTLDPNCCTFNWDTSCVDLAFEVCNDCGDIDAGSCFAAHGSPSCANATCCNEVCAIDEFCCQEQWDDLCVIYAQKNCGEPTINCGLAITRSCFIPSYLPGCDDATCCDDICTGIDPFCCEVCWDAICAEEAGELCGLAPGCPKRGYCFAIHANPGCNDPVCCSAVCEVDTACCFITWDAHCVSFARAICFGQGVCPGPDECTLTHGTPGCNDAACCNVVCNIDPVCCTEAWDAHCVTAAQQSCLPDSTWQCPCIGSCFEEHANAGCDDQSCCSGVCLVFPECCTVAWDADCANFARIRCCGDFGCADIACGNWCSGSCFESHGQPFCDNAACCEAVCKIDPFCCDTLWDGGCAAFAFDRCGGQCGNAANGSCFVNHVTAGCSDKECCAAVCDEDPFCCNLSWDDTCVTLAVGDGRRRRALCERPECGSTETGDCCYAHPLPACEDQRCCEEVCATDEYCCDVEWDLNCATEARISCGLCIEECGDPCADSCCVPHDYPFCNDQACCDAVCAIDPICCELDGGTWDVLCAAQASTLGDCGEVCPQPECGDKDAGNCCFAHPNAACDDESCCDDVCQQDAFCCDSQWDTVCAETAQELCVELCEGEPSGGECGAVHPEPGCDDAKCEFAVCFFLPECCTISWDASCVAQANKFCVLEPLPAGSGDPRRDRLLRRAADERASRRTDTKNEGVKRRR